MSDPRYKEIAERTAQCIIEDHDGRNGEEICTLDLDVQQEILAAWTEIITAAINEAVELVASNAAKNLYGIAEAYCTERDQLRAENAELQRKVKELEAHRKRIEYLGALEKQRMLDSGNDCDHLVLALDGRTCWGETFIEAVDNAMRHDGLLKRQAGSYGATRQSRHGGG